ncbi:MAG: type 4a pilus biogenesis protein PilO [Candidatus Omnitrophota bacterium]
MNINDLDLKTITPDKIKELFAEEKFRTYFVAAFASILAVVYIFIAIIPKCSLLSKTSREIRDFQTNIDLVENRIRRLDALTKKLSDVSAELESYAKGLPAKKDLPAFLEELSLLAKSSGIKILSITPAVIAYTKESVPSEKGYYREVPIIITAESGYHQLGYFISSLERSKRFITITDLKIKGNERSPRKHDVRISLNTYVSDE